MNDATHSGDRRIVAISRNHYASCINFSSIITTTMLLLTSIKKKYVQSPVVSCIKVDGLAGSGARLDAVIHVTDTANKQPTDDVALTELNGRLASIGRVSVGGV